MVLLMLEASAVCFEIQIRFLVQGNPRSVAGAGSGLPLGRVRFVCIFNDRIVLVRPGSF